MKKLVLFLSIVSVFASCEDIQDNSPAFQANLDNEFYRALDSRVILAEDGSIAIVGATTDQNMTLILSTLQGGTFELNSGNGHQAIFEDATGQIYSTEFGGGGVVNITSRVGDNGNESLSGDFTFQAILPGVDTLVVSKGLLFQIPIAPGIIEDPTDPTDPNDPNQTGGLVAEIDGNLFDPSTVIANTTETSIEINGALGDDTIQLIIPLDAAPATYDIPGGGFNAIYFISGDEEPAVSGTIRVFAHDMVAGSISGTFSFTTANHVISQGQFNVNY